MKKIFKLLAVVLVVATLTGCSIKNEAYKNKSAQEFIQAMEEIKDGVPEDCEFDYEVKNTLDDKAQAKMWISYHGHDMEMTITFDSWEADAFNALNDLDEQELMDKHLIIKIDGVRYTDYAAADALMSVYFSE